MKKELENMFTDMSKEDLLNFFNDCDIEVEEVNSGEGGFYLDDKKIGYPFCSSRINKMINYVDNISSNVGFNSKLYKCINSMKNTKKINVKEYMDNNCQIHENKDFSSYKKKVSTTYEEELTGLEAA
ncbi:hypothetical protein NHI66_003161 [Clostridium botulinum]|nr:hypothetical protein [Clostridium botulinum]